MTQMIEKKKYEKPSMMVYKMQEQTQLLQSSSSPLEPTLPIEPEWPGGLPW